MQAISSGCQLDVERGPGWLLVRVQSLPTEPTEEPSFSSILWDLLDRHFTYRVVLELDEVEVLNSYLIGQLVKLYKLIRQHDGVLRLCGLSPYNLQVLQTCRLEGHFCPYQDREEAVMASALSRRAK